MCVLDPREEIRQKTDIVELIGDYLTLKPAGTHGFRALCPFHSEKTPSFHVSSDRQIWHCFGCGEGGDCFSFVMKMEGMDFPEALLHLGQKAGVEVRRVASTQGNLKQRIQEINDLSAKFYHKILKESAIAKHTREYVESRGIESNLIEKFQLGYSPNEWDSLTQFLLKRGFSENEIVTAGLGQKKRTGIGLFDRFRDRLMIPLRDHHGHTVGFTARILPASITSPASLAALASSPKYINSPETPLYHKGSLLYGLDLAKTSIKQKNFAIVVEGNLDVVGSHKAEVENVVASSGTALTEDQLRLLGRYTKTIVFCFDQDAAGFAAAKRGVPIARALGFDVRAIILPDGSKDPDELAQKNPHAWQELSAKSVPIMQYLIDRVTTGKDLKNVDDKRTVSQELLPALSEIVDVVEQEHWLKVVGNLLGIDSSILRSHVQIPITQNPEPRTQNLQTTKRSKIDQAVMMLIGLLVADPTTYAESIKSINFSENSLSPLLELYKESIKIYNSLDLAQQKLFFSRLENHFRSSSREDLIRLLHESTLLSEQSFSHLPPQEVQKQLNTLILLIQHSFAQQKRKTIAQELRQAEQAGDKEAIKRLMLEL